MKKNILFILLLGFVISLTSSCKSEFEKLRASGDAKEMYKQAFAYYEEGDYNKAQTLFEIVLAAYRGKVEAEKIYYHYADCQYKLRKYLLAGYYFKDFASKFANSSYKEDAEFMSAYSYFKMSPSYRLDQTYTQKAIDNLQLFVNTYPTSSRVSECNELIDGMRKKLEAKAYSEGELYFNLKQYQASIQSFQNLLRDFPETTDSERVRYMMTRASYLFAQNSVVLKQAERLRETLELCEGFYKKYPESTYQKELKDITDFCNKKLKDLKDDRYQI